MTCNRNTMLCTTVHCAVKMLTQMVWSRVSDGFSLVHSAEILRHVTKKISNCSVDYITQIQIIINLTQHISGTYQVACLNSSFVNTRELRRNFLLKKLHVGTCHCQAVSISLLKCLDHDNNSHDNNNDTAYMYDNIMFKNIFIDTHYHLRQSH